MHYIELLSTHWQLTVSFAAIMYRHATDATVLPRETLRVDTAKGCKGLQRAI